MNIYDYFIWRGDLSFDIDPINEVDYLVFSQLAYCSFDEFFTNDKALSIRELGNRLKNYNNDLDLDKFTVEFIDRIYNTKRYGDLLIHDYVSILNEKEVEQFAAMMIDVNRFKTIVAFRGTDDSLIGWQEDFELICSKIKAQDDALLYLERCNKLFKKYVVLGHSKGGYLALYSSTNTDSKIQKKIEKIISYDGPGMKLGTYNIEGFNRIKDRFVKYLPTYDMFGLMFDNDNEKIIVSSIANGPEQHSVLTWQVNVNSICRAEAFENETELIRRAVRNFMNKVSNDDMKIFVSELFDELRNSDIEQVSDFTSGDIRRIIKVLINIRGVSKKTKNVIAILFQEFVGEFGNNFLSGITNKFSKNN